MSLTSAASETKLEVANEARKAGPWLKLLVRGGYVAKGILYGFIGVLAAMAALRIGGKVANQKGAIDTLALHPLGPALLYAMAIGLAAYSTWRLLTALFNPEGQKAFKRVGYALAAMAYYGFALAAFEAARGVQDNGGGLQRWLPLIESPLGRFVAIGGGLAFIGVAIAQAIKAIRRSFMADLVTGEMSPSERQFAEVTGIVGLCARSLIFGVTGWLFARAGFHRDAKEAGGMSKSLQTMSIAPEGRWLLLAVSVGLILYGLFMFVQARYRRIEVSS